MGCGRTARVCVGRLPRRSSRLPTKPRGLTSSRHRPPTATTTTTWRTASEVHTQRCPGSCYPPLLAGGLGGARTGNLGSGLGASRTGHRAQRDVVVVIRTPFRLRLRLRHGLRHGTGTGFECDQEYERRPCSRMPSTGTHHSYGGFDGTGRDGWDVRSGAFCAVPLPSRGGWRSLRVFSAAATARRYLD